VFGSAVVSAFECVSLEKNIKLMLIIVFFDMLMSKMKNKRKKIILMYFHVKNTFEMHSASQYQTHQIMLNN
jgi:CRISPR/Cas system-associated protein endoribonuclease Cas2